MRGDIKLTEKLDALPPKKKRMRRWARFFASEAHLNCPNGLNFGAGS